MSDDIDQIEADRQRLGITQERLAKLCGMNRAAYQKYLRGALQTPPDRAQALRGALELVRRGLPLPPQRKNEYGGSSR